MKWASEKKNELVFIEPWNDEEKRFYDKLGFSSITDDIMVLKPSALISIKPKTETVSAPEYIQDLINVNLEEKRKQELKELMDNTPVAPKEVKIVVNASIQNIILGMKAISQIGTNSLMIGMKITMKKMISLSTFGQQKELICTLMQMI